MDGPGVDWSSGRDGVPELSLDVHGEDLGVGEMLTLCMSAYLQQLPARGVEAACVKDNASVLTASLGTRASFRGAARDGAAGREESDLRIGQGSFGERLHRRQKGRHDA